MAWSVTTLAQAEKRSLVDHSRTGPDHVETLCLTPLGYPRGRFGPTDRIPSADVSSYNRFGEK